MQIFNHSPQFNNSFIDQLTLPPVIITNHLINFSSLQNLLILITTFLYILFFFSFKIRSDQSAKDYCDKTDNYIINILTTIDHYFKSHSNSSLHTFLIILNFTPLSFLK
jgi:hypothetical protein